MILAFSGDPFLASRAARRALRAQVSAEATTELGAGMTGDEVAQLAAQSGLFGAVALLLDFDAAFTGQAGVKPRNEVVKALEGVPADTLVVVLDSSATASRQKTYQALGKHEHLPTPRFNALAAWVRSELKTEGVRFDKDVPDTLADLFGEDLPGVAAEVQKLAVLGETLTSARVREVVNRPAARDAFGFIDALTQGDAKAALLVLRSLQAQGEAPPRVLGALSWQFGLVARCVGLREDRGEVSAGFVAQALKVKPFVAQKALGLARGLDEARLLGVLTALLQADVAMKTGGDGVWALEALALELAGFFGEA